MFDERNPAVVEYPRQLISCARSLGLKTSICDAAGYFDAAERRVLLDAVRDATG